MDFLRTLKKRRPKKHARVTAHPQETGQSPVESALGGEVRL